MRATFLASTPIVLAALALLTGCPGPEKPAPPGPAAAPAARADAAPKPDPAPGPGRPAEADAAKKADPAPERVQTREEWLRRIRKGMTALELADALTAGGSSDASLLEKLAFVPPAGLRAEIEKYASAKVADKVLPRLPPCERYAVLKTQGYPTTAHWLFAVVGYGQDGVPRVLFRAVENWGCFACVASDVTIDEDD
ncbi:MAG: hypothetical protein MUC63_05305 [Planctomycetes bacterium]|jgi:hypothetical protein|nr:hypothetical protein [Planctomycetota bacterium]